MAQSIYCSVCNTPGSIFCNGCLSSCYCSVECQQTDWPAHELLCSAALHLSPRPTPLYKLGILFSVNSDIQFVWVECERWYNTADFTPNLETLLGEENPIPDYRIIARNTFRGYNLSNRSIHIYYLDVMSTDSSSPNESVVKSTQGMQQHDWMGPIVVLRAEGKAGNPWVFQDVTQADFRVAVDFFIQSGEQTMEELAIRGMYPEIKVNGVKINCEADLKPFGAEQYAAVRVPRDHPIFHVTEPVEISKYLGFPILVYRYLFDIPLGADTLPYTNSPASYLHMCFDPSALACGMVPLGWDTLVGSVLVVRQDRKDITPHQVEALCSYCELGGIVPDDVGKGGFFDALSDSIARDLLNRNKFREYFEEYAESRTLTDAAWFSATPPL